jgi:hypothetical protein
MRRSFLTATATACYLSFTSAQNLAETLAGTGLVAPAEAQLLADSVWSTAASQDVELQRALAQPGIPALQRTDSESYYAGQSPAVYPSRKLC